MPKMLPMQRVAALWSEMTGAPRPHRSTLIRWVVKGVKGRRLRAELLGGRWYSWPDAVSEFHRAMTTPGADVVDRTAGPTRTARIQADIDELDELIGTQCDTTPQPPTRNRNPR
jgi:hypothetical protein